MPTVHIGGKQISYWTGTEGLLKERESVLFIHGAGGGEYTWSSQKGLFGKTFNLIIMELPGHGGSGGEGEEEIGRYAEHVYGFIKALGLSKVFLIGHSMGGAIVLTMALTHPEMAKGIVLVGTGARLKVFPMILNGIMGHFEEMVREITKFAYSPKAPAELIERGVLDMMKCNPQVLYGDFLACDRFDLINEVDRINLPALILCGEEDKLTPIKYSQFLNQRIKNSKLELFPDAGHMVMMESAKAFNMKVNQFLMGISNGF